MGKNPSYFRGPDLPVDSVSWDDAQAFISKMNGIKLELQLCLPTEAQWEYACRAGTTTPFFWGNEINSEIVNFHGTYSNNKHYRSENRKKKVEVKHFPCNDWGLYQTHGNVWEWVQDWHGDYPKSPTIDPPGPKGGDSRVMRGGSWSAGEWFCTSFFRNHSECSNRNYNFGFRLARCR